MSGAWLAAYVAERSKPALNGCRLWTRAVGRSGYGVGWDGTRRLSAHRMAWEGAFGPIPAGVMVCHRCDEKRCVEPAHLFVGTGFDNARDAALKGLFRQQQKLVCPRGHAYTDGNTRWNTAKGRAPFRVCRLCSAAHDKKRRTHES